MSTPTVAHLEAATAATAAAIETGDLADVYLAAEAEEARNGAGDMTPAATAADVLAVFTGEVTGAEADATLASYFAPGPEPRYDTPQARAEAEAANPEPEMELEL